MNKQAELAAQILPATFLSLHGLAERGLSRHRVSQLVAVGKLVRLRNGRYVRGDLHDELIRTGTLGGRLDCVSLAAALGVFVRVRPKMHMQFEPGTTRLPDRPADAIAHWRHSSADRCALSVDIVEALAQACRCQAPRDAVATLDSAWQHGIIDEAHITAIFARLPARYQTLRSLLDRRSESGSETIMRLMLRGLGCDVAVQVKLRGVGRVDFVVDGWLIVECDSRAHHEGWEAQKRDRARDLAAAAMGYMTVRPIAEDILYRTDEVLTLMKSVLAHAPRRGPLQNSTDPRRKGQRQRS